MLESKFVKLVLNNWLSSIILGLIVGITGLALFTSGYGWKIYLEIFSHFQLQYFVLILVLLAVLVWLRRQPFILIGLFCCAILAVQIVPWYLPSKNFLPQNAANLRIFVANVNAQNRSYAQTISLVRKEKPDLAVFIEVDNNWVEKLNSLNDLLPYAFGKASNDYLGLMVYSQEQLIAPEIEYFGSEKNVSVVSKLAIADQTLFLVATHPPPPLGSRLFDSRNQQLDAIAKYLQTVSEPVVMVGDLNLTMWSPYYRRLINSTGLKNARQGFGILPTWPVPGNFSPLPQIPSRVFSIPIDHCLISPKLSVSDIRTKANLDSDHRALIIDLEVPSN